MILNNVVFRQSKRVGAGPVVVPAPRLLLERVYRRLRVALFERGATEREQDIATARVALLLVLRVDVEEDRLVRVIDRLDTDPLMVVFLVAFVFVPRTEPPRA